MPVFISAADALTSVKSGMTVFIHGCAATPQVLVKALVDRAPELKNVQLVSLMPLGDTSFAQPEYQDSFFINALFISDGIRKAVKEGRGSYIPIFLSDIPELFRYEIMPLDVALLTVSPPDKHGFCSLGVSVDVARTALLKAKYVIAQVNQYMPRSLGDALIHINEIDALVEGNVPLPEVSYGDAVTEVEEKIGHNIAELVEDGSTLQMGIGGIPDCVLRNLKNHKDLGVHTEMFSDGVIDLVERGVINNKYKKKHPGRLVATFIIGTRRVYDFIDDNPQVFLLDVDYTNDDAVIRRNPKVVAINSAIEIDLTGQVCADSIGTYQYSGIGGQMDFMRGAAMSEGGKPIIAISSTTKNGISRIVPFINQGGGIVTSRGHVHYVVTEYGVAYLFGKNMQQRAKELIRIAHPDHQEALEKAAFERFGRI